MPFSRLFHCSVFLPAPVWEIFLVWNPMWQYLVVWVIKFLFGMWRNFINELGIMKVMQTWKFVILTRYCWFPTRRIWVNQPIHSFFVGCLNPCLQETNVKSVRPRWWGGVSMQLWAIRVYVTRIATFYTNRVWDLKGLFFRDHLDLYIMHESSYLKRITVLSMWY